MTRRTKTGRELTDADLDALAVEVETTEYDIEALKERRTPGRPMKGSSPGDVFSVRFDSELREAIEERAKADSKNASDVIREAVRNHLDVA